VPDVAPEAGLRAELAQTAARIEDLNRELAAIAESTEAVPDDEHDAEGSTVAYERARVQALLTHAQRARADLEAAAGRIAAGTYRICVGCGGEIPAERLNALPATRTCVECAAAAGAARL